MWDELMETHSPSSETLEDRNAAAVLTPPGVGMVVHAFSRT